ncbi:hypothetical protein B0H13DRAFT_2664483 [Mycena leptocephala]|nr:hypothetical protein B0H13DRAFT_2664483 [Mycena leptocephala]
MFDRNNTEKVYAVIGGATPAVYGQTPFLTGSSSSPTLPIVIKCNNNAQANEACSIHTIFESLNCRTAEKQPDAFAMAIARSSITEPSSGDWGANPQASSTREQIPRRRAREDQTTRPIFSHVRDLTGVINTIYGSTSGPPMYRSYELGKLASQYLQAHGFTESAIKEIQDIWARSEGNVESFVALLSPRGMAATEIRWLWDIIGIM